MSSKKPKTDAQKRAGAEAARSTKAGKSVSPPAKVKAPPAPPKSSKPKTVPPKGARRSVPPPAKSADAPNKLQEIAHRLAARDAETVEPPKPKVDTAAKAKAARVRAIADAAQREAKQTYWGGDKPVEAIALEAAVTVAPPSRAKSEVAEEEDDIWSADPAPELSEQTHLTHGSHGADPLRAAADFGSSQSLLATDYYFRQYGAHGMRSLAAETDDFGYDPHVDEKLRPLLDLIAQKYFRVELVGAEHLPAVGRALMVANRGGTLPWDGLVLRAALRNSRSDLSPLRWLAEDSVIHYPFMGVLMNRLGAVRACPENAERLLAQDRLVAVFPEGAQGSRKLFRDRYRLQRFGRGGYVKLALKFGVPIFPTAIIGAEDTNPVLRRSRLLGRLIGSDTVPITPTFPWFGLAGLLPAPVRWRIAIGEPIDLSSYGPDAAEDALVVHRLNEQIRTQLQALVDESKTARGSSLFG
jgi:1-acyl-sn-glycerol-3-phosphate acyltransferase